MKDPRIEAAAKALYSDVNRQHSTTKGWDEVRPRWQESYRSNARAVIEAIDNASTITTVEELDALPIRSIVACMGIAPGTRNIPVTLVWQRGSVDNGGSDWCMPDTQGQITSTDVFYFLSVNELRQELTVLHWGN